MVAPCAVAFSNFVRIEAQLGGTRQRCQYIARLEEIRSSRFDTIPWMYVRWHVRFWMGREMEMSYLCNAKKSPGRFCRGPSHRLLGQHLRAGLLHARQYINQYSNTPALHHFIIPSRGNLLVSNPVRSFARYHHAVKHASTSQSTKHQARSPVTAGSLTTHFGVSASFL